MSQFSGVFSALFGQISCYRSVSQGGETAKNCPFSRKNPPLLACVTSWVNRPFSAKIPVIGLCHKLGKSAKNWPIFMQKSPLSACVTSRVKIGQNGRKTADFHAKIPVIGLCHKLGNFQEKSAKKRPIFTQKSLLLACVTSWVIFERFLSHVRAVFHLRRRYQPMSQGGQSGQKTADFHAKIPVIGLCHKGGNF